MEKDARSTGSETKSRPAAMAPTKAQDTSHLNQFSAEELEDILVQLCDSEGVKVSADDDKALKNVGKNALDNIGLGGLGKKVFGGGGKKQEAPPESPDGLAPPPPPAPRPASDVIRELNIGDKQGLIGVLQSVISSALSGDLDGKSGTGGNLLRRNGQLSLKALANSALFACFGNLLKGGGDKSRTAHTTSASAGGTEAEASSAQGNFSIDDIKTPEALFKYITSNPAIKTVLISGIQTFLANTLQGQTAAKA
ncbi:uncharacterized protein LOC111263672 isoform X2 [Varroa jacobsoni]|uniref:uncharacterized protein LOC111263672 isoform X2 n=1 Tax=Varroa jacobsoni TaxID=62625 RepID=UPI000BFA4DC9|nr:uncharacterized protein LOC111263672 isoform X2 [Varroa jacobsoni]